MTSDDELLCDPGYRDLFTAWVTEEITREEAVFLARRVEFALRIEFLPQWMNSAALSFFDLLFEP